jgi:hypothetical protein
MPKRSRIAVITTIWKPDTKSVRKMTVGIPDGPVFGGSLYVVSSNQWLPSWPTENWPNQQTIFEIPILILNGAH